MKHVESYIQKQCVKWFRLQYRHLYPLLFSVPNGGQRDIRVAQSMKAEGIVAGVSDMIFLYPSHGFHALCIEFKTEHGRQSEAQVEFEKAVTVQGYKYVLVRNFMQFYYLIRFWLGEITAIPDNKDTVGFSQ